MFPAFPSAAPRGAVVMIVAAAAAFAAPTARAVQPFVIKDIRVEGLQRTEAGTVFASLPFRVGDTYTDEKGAAALRALFATGLFKDVRIEIEGPVAVVIVEERAVIAKVDFTGTREFDRDTLIKALKDIGVGEGQPFDKALADRAEQELKRQYLTRSLYGAEVTTTITPLERNRVNVAFTVTEGEPAKIGEIRILGSKVFSESTLLGLLEQTTTGWLTWYTKSDRYSRTKLNADLETIRSYYLNRGYLEFSIESTQVTISPDKQSINIAVTVKEGQPYTVTGVKLEGELLGRDEEFKRLVAVRPGQTYRDDAVSATKRAFTDYLGTFGYAFARVDSRPEIDKTTGQVQVTLTVDPGRRVYVRRMLVSGNTRTRDEVIRREFRQFEGAWYDGTRIKFSRDRVERLGYFKEVTVDTNEVPGAPDQVDVTIAVTERPTGNVMVGAGYSSQQGISFTGSIREENVLGSGSYLGLEVNTAKTGRALSVSTVNPYYTVDGVSRGIDVFYRTSKPYNSFGDVYEFATYGGSLRFGVPFSELDTVFFGLGVEKTHISTNAGIPLMYKLQVLEQGNNSLAIPMTIGWQNEQRDSIISPTAGKYQRVNLEMSALGDARYARASLQWQQFFPITNKFSWMFNAQLDWGMGLGGRKYPIFKNYYAGGLGSVRVFEANSLGPVDLTGSNIGGNLRANVNAELYIPVPGAGNDKSFRLFTFVDAGNVWDTKSPLYKVSLDSIRVSAGIGISWMSPMGPLKLSMGKPIRKEAKDRIEKFQFQVGTAF